MVSPAEQFTDGAGFDWARMRHIAWEYPERRVATFGDNRFLVVGSNGADLVAELFSVALGDVPEMTLLATATLTQANSGGHQWLDDESRGLIRCTDTVAVFANNTQYYNGTSWEGHISAVTITVGADNSLTFGTPFQFARDQSNINDTAYGYAMCSRANPADGVVLVYIRQTSPGMDLAAVCITPSGTATRTMLGYRGSDGVARENTGYTYYVEGPSAQCQSVGGQEYLLLSYGFFQSGTSGEPTETVITACPISGTSVSLISGSPARIFNGDQTEVMRNGEGMYYPRTRLANGATEGLVLGQMPSYMRGSEGSNNTEIRVFSAEFNGTSWTVPFTDLLQQDTTRNAEPYDGPVVVPPGTDDAITMYINVYGLDPNYQVFRWNVGARVAQGGFGSDALTATTAAYGDVDWSFFGETGWAVVALNNYVGGAYGQALWLVNTHILPPVSRIARSISARRGGPRVVFE